MRHRRCSSRISRSLALACILALSFSGTRLAPAAAAFQADEDELADAGVDGNQYESPIYGYTLEWDEDVWEVGDATTDERSGDALQLNSDLGNLFVDGYEDYDGNAEDCLNDILEKVETNDNVEDFAPLQDEDGEDIADSDDELAFAAYTYTFLDGEDPVDVAQYTECRTLVPGSDVLQIDIIAPEDDLSDQRELADEVLGTLEIPEAEQNAEDEDATEEAEDEDDVATEESETTDEDATEEADEDEVATEEAVEDEDATEESDSGDENLAGVDGDTYTSPTYDYSLEWDGDVWSVETDTSEDDVDTLVLNDDVSQLTIIGTAEFGENLDRCLRLARRQLESIEGIEDVTAAEDESGEPIEIDEVDRVGAVFQIFLGDTETADQLAQVECRVAVEGEAVIQIVQIVDAEDFNDEIDPVAAVLDSILIEGATEPEEEPTEEPEEEEENPALSAIDGNTYLSPNFGYTLEWDEDVWEFDGQDDSISTSPGFDYLFLGSSGSGLSIVGTTQYTDPQECVDGFVAFFRGEDAVDNWRPLEDENGDRIEGEEGDVVFAAFSFTSTSGGQEAELIQFFECRSIVEDESVLFVVQTTDEAGFEEESQNREDLLESLTIPDADEASATNTDSTETTENDPADDESTDTSPGTDGDADVGDPNADLDSYTDPDYPFTVTWDEAAWSVVDQRTVAEGHNLVELSNNDSDLTIEGWLRWDGDPSECLNTLATNVQAIDGVTDFQRVTDSDLYPEGASSTGANALFSFTIAQEGRTPIEYISYIECRTVVEGEAVISVTLLAPAEDYESGRADFEFILRNIQIEE